MASAVFLDTTVLADYLFSSQPTKTAIAKRIAGSRPFVTRYVFDQFRSTFLHCAVLLYNSLQRTKDVDVTIAETDTFPHFDRGEGVKARKILTSFVKSDVSIEGVGTKLSRLERLIDHEMEERVREISESTDATACCLCHGDPSMATTGQYVFGHDCNLKNPRPCAIERFWHERKGAITALADADKVARENSDILKALKAASVVASGKKPRGQLCTVDLSDAVIVAESFEDSVILTSNTKDFSPLARIIGGGRRVERCPDKS